MIAVASNNITDYTGIPNVLDFGRRSLDAESFKNSRLKVGFT